MHHGRTPGPWLVSSTDPVTTRRMKLWRHDHGKERERADAYDSILDDSDSSEVMGVMPAIERHGENVVFSITK